MGSFVADLAFRTPRLPRWGETVMGSSFCVGPGGKGSNQAVAAARLGALVTFISKVGRDTFGEIARRTYAQEGIDAEFLFESVEEPTGSAAILIDEAKGENAIVVVPGACLHLTAQEVDGAKRAIAESAVFVTQLELPISVVEHGLRLARKLGVTTILNPAPAHELPETIYPLCDYLTPNEAEADALTGVNISNESEAERAAACLLARSTRNVIITLRAQGALIKNPQVTQLVSPFKAGPVVETTGAGDAFNGGFATALAEGMNIVPAARFGCAAAGISVTRPGTAPSMPRRSEVDALLR